MSILDYFGGWNVAIIFGAILFIVKRLLSPPKELAHLPQVPIWSAVWITVTAQGFEKLNDLTEPILRKHGICLSWRYGQWNILLGRAEDAQRMFKETRLFPKQLITERLPNTKFAEFIGENIIYSNGQDWKRHRRPVKKFFKKRWDPHPVVEICRLLIQRWDKLCDKPISVQNWTKRLTLDILGHVLFGLEFNELGYGNGRVVHLYVQTFYLIYKFIYIAFPFLDWFRQGKLKVISEYEALIDDYINSRTVALEEGKIDPNADALTAMISHNSNTNGPKLSRVELKNTFKMLFLAGHDTTATALSGVLYHLALHQEIQERLREELVMIFGDSGPITPNQGDLTQLNYLTMVIKESLRLLPPVAVDVERENLNPIQIQGYLIPPHSTLQAHIMHIQREPLYWPLPTHFIPERFDPSNGEESAPHYFPFLSGARQCLGIDLAMLELKVCLAMIFHKFKVTWPESIPRTRLPLGPMELIFPAELDLCFTPRY